MFYVCLIVAFIALLAGFVSAPGYWKLASVAAFLLLVMFLPAVLAKVFDPINAKRIRAHCRSIGVTDIEVSPFPNHYGVRFTKNAKRHYAKCVVVGKKVRWKGPSPEEMQ